MEHNIEYRDVKVRITSIDTEGNEYFLGTIEAWMDDQMRVWTDDEIEFTNETTKPVMIQYNKMECPEIAEGFSVTKNFCIDAKGIKDKGYLLQPGDTQTFVWQSDFMFKVE